MPRFCKGPWLQGHKPPKPVKELKASCPFSCSPVFWTRKSYAHEELKKFIFPTGSQQAVKIEQGSQIEVLPSLQSGALPFTHRDKQLQTQGSMRH